MAAVLATTLDWCVFCNIPSLQIIILWNSEKPQPSRSKWPPMPVPLTVTDGRRKVRNQPVCLWSSVMSWSYLSDVFAARNVPFSSRLKNLLWFSRLSVRKLDCHALICNSHLSLPDHQSVSTSRCHRNRGGAEPGRGHGPVDQRGELCLLGVAELPWPDRGLPSQEPLLGPSEESLGLHL